MEIQQPTQGPSFMLLYKNYIFNYIISFEQILIKSHAFQVSIFSLLEDSKFEHFKPVMDAYITGHFAAALVYK